MKKFNGVASVMPRSAGAERYGDFPVGGGNGLNISVSAGVCVFCTCSRADAGGMPKRLAMTGPLGWLQRSHSLPGGAAPMLEKCTAWCHRSPRLR
jgi:hypothetical protein